MHKIVIICDPAATRMWQVELLQRLQGAGYRVGIRHGSAGEAAHHRLDRVLTIEAKRFGAGLAQLVSPPPLDPIDEPQLLIDLAGSAQTEQVPVLRLAFNGRVRFADGLSQMLATNTLPVVTTMLAEQTVGIARPMLSDRLWLTRASNDILAGAISLVEQSVARFFAGALAAVEVPAAEPAVPGFFRHYLPQLAAGLALRFRQKLTRTRPFYWQTAFRISEGAGVAERAALEGAPFTTLEDDGQRFYADPFVVEHDGATFLFVEEYPYATGKGVISVARLGPDGRFGVPKVVVEEPYHLSYPQVFSHGGDMFMLPESGGARRLVLYQAVSFPDLWVVDTVLLDDTDINDATLLERDGRFWLFGTERRGAGSASDTLVVFSAPALRGPWVPHRLNPIAIDRSAARPGGAFVERDGRTFLPMQDGRDSYGGGLGLAELLRLDDDAVIFAAPVPIRPGGAWPGRKIHTLNRAAGVEVVDSAS
nr:hypothetical protein [uncultured Devosia sp.]